MTHIDLKTGICDADKYHAWKFPGGEIHMKLKTTPEDKVNIKTNLKSSDDLILLCLMCDTLTKYNPKIDITVYIQYMAYQQADRDFGYVECFSLKTICNILNGLNVNQYHIYDCHSDVAPALLKNCTVLSNDTFIQNVLYNWKQSNPGKTTKNNLIILAPDAGAYKKIFKLCEDIKFDGRIECCAKSRNHDTGEKTIIVPRIDGDQDILVIDDICLAGGTFLGVASGISDKNKLFLAVSHGIFNNGVDHLLKVYDTIYTTNSRCEINNDKVKIYKL